MSCFCYLVYLQKVLYRVTCFSEETSSFTLILFLIFATTIWMNTQNPIMSLSCSHSSQLISKPAQQTCVLLSFSISYWNCRLTPNLLPLSVSGWTKLEPTTLRIHSCWCKALTQKTGIICMFLEEPHLSQMCISAIGVWCNMEMTVNRTSYDNLTDKS